MAIKPREEFIFTGVIPGVRDGKIYNNAESKDVEKYVIFANLWDWTVNNECFAYKDQACIERMTCEEMRNAFIKGAMVILFDYGNIAYITPVTYSEREFLIDGEIPAKAGSLLLPSSEILPEGFIALESAEIADMSK